MASEILRKSAALLVCAELAFAQITPQQIPADEMRIRSGDYTLLPEASAVLRAQADLVLARVVIRDARGKPVGGLQQSDFQLFDNGKPQTISTFSIEAAEQPAPQQSQTGQSIGTIATAAPRSPPPRYVALFFDDTSLKLGDMVHARTAAEAFIAGHLKDTDRIGVFTSSGHVTLEFTNDAKKVAEALAKLRTQLYRPDDGPGSCPRIGPYQAQLIVSHDRQALALAAEQARVCLTPLSASGIRMRAENVLFLAERHSREKLSTLRSVINYLGRMPGQRALVLASSGFWTSTLQYEQARLVDHAVAANVVINTLDTKGIMVDASVDLTDGRPISLGQRPDLETYANLLANAQRSILEDPLAIMAEGTGGRFFHNSNDLDRGFRELAGEPETAYLLGFIPQDLRPNGSFHSLKVNLTRRDNYNIQARKGYFAPTRKELAESNRPTFDAIVSRSSEVPEIPVEISIKNARSEAGDPALKIVVRVDVRALPFQRRDGRHIDSMRMVTALFDGNGTFLHGTQSLVELSLREATLARLASEGLELQFTVQAPAGSYTLRQVVQESVEGKFGALSRAVEIQ